MNKKNVFFLLWVTLVSCFFTPSFAQIERIEPQLRIFEPQPREEAERMYSLWARATMGEFTKFTPQYEKTVGGTKVLFETAGLGALVTAAGASLAYAFRGIPATMGQVLLKKAGEAAVVGGLTAVGGSLSALGIIILNPSTAQGSEITPDELGYFLLYDLHEAMLAYSQYPDNFFLQKTEIEQNRYYLNYKLHRIKTMAENSSPEEYTQKLALNKGLASYEEYISLLKKEEEIISTKIEAYNQRYFENHDEKIKASWRQFEQAYTDMRQEENIQKIETATVQKLIHGEQDWNTIIEDLSSGKTPRWLEFMLSL